MRHLAAVKDQGPLLRTHRAGAPALGAGVLHSQSVCLALQQDREGAFREARGGSAGNLLHGLEIDTGTRPRIPEDAAGDDLAPLGGKVSDGLKILRGGLTLRHE